MFCLKYDFRNEKYVFLNEGKMGICTLGARDFSSAVSGFCQVFIVTRAKSAFGQHRKFPPHARKNSGTQGRVFATQMGICCEVKFSR